MLELIVNIMIGLFILFMALPWIFIVLSPFIVVGGVALFPIMMMANKSVSRMKILIADDDEVSIAPLLAALKKKHVPVTISYVATGEDALKSLKQTHYDLLILDYFMPGITGLDILSKADEEKKVKPTTPVVFYTGYADMMNSAHSRHLDRFIISDVWEKSLNFSILDKKIGTALALAS